MKNIIFITALLVSFNCFGTLFTGTLLCKETSKPIEYANVGIVGKDVGTTTDINGKFTINLEEIFDTNIIKISLIGFKSFEMKIKDFKNVYKNKSAIYLSEQLIQLNEVVISKSKEIKHKHYGATSNSKLIVAGFDTSAQGHEAGVLIETKKFPTFIDSVQINICNCEIDSIFFRLNIYEDIGSTFINILNEPIYIKMSSSEIKNHKIIVDLSKKKHCNPS